MEDLEDLASPITYYVSDADYYKLYAAQQELQAATSKAELAELQLIMSRSKFENTYQSMIAKMTQDGLYTVQDGVNIDEKNRVVTLILNQK